MVVETLMGPVNMTIQICQCPAVVGKMIFNKIKTNSPLVYIHSIFTSILEISCSYKVLNLMSVSIFQVELPKEFHPRGFN